MMYPPLVAEFARIQLGIARLNSCEFSYQRWVHHYPAAALCLHNFGLCAFDEREHVVLFGVRDLQMSQRVVQVAEEKLPVGF